MREEPAPHGRLVVRWDLIERDPTLGMADWPRPRRRQTYRLSASEVRLFLAEFCHVRLGPALGLVVGAGLRRAEICGLRWEDVNFEAGTVCPKRNVVPCSSEMGGGLQVCQTKTESSSAAPAAVSGGAGRVRTAGQIERFKTLHDLPVMLGHRPSVVARRHWNAFEPKSTGGRHRGWCGHLLSASKEISCPSGGNFLSAYVEYELSALTNRATDSQGRPSAK